MLGDPLFYLVSVPAVLLYGVAKGGFGGAIAILAVPLMATLMSPVQAAAILLPILVFMDALVVRAYWGVFDKLSLKLLLPPALLGVLLGYLSVEAMSDDYMRILVGVIALLFGLHSLLGQASRLGANLGAQHNRWWAGFFGTLAGFTSFSIHAGGAPFTIYLLPKKLPPLVLCRYRRPVLRCGQRRQADTLLRSRSVQQRQPAVLSGAGAVGAAGCPAGTFPSQTLAARLVLRCDQFFPHSPRRRTPVGGYQRRAAGPSELAAAQFAHTGG